jgi:hypothetical protein
MRVAIALRQTIASVFSALVVLCVVFFVGFFIGYTSYPLFPFTCVAWWMFFLVLGLVAAANEVVRVLGLGAFICACVVEPNVTCIHYPIAIGTRDAIVLKQTIASVWGGDPNAY